MEDQLPDSLSPTEPNETASSTGQMTKKQRRALRKQQDQEARKRDARGKKAKTWIAWLAVIAAIALGLWLLVARSNSTGTATVPPATDATDQDWTLGGASAQATIIEYSDFQCPACGAYHSIVQQLTEEFGDRIKFVYRHFPLRTIHPNAAPAAQAAEAAGTQNAFWEMHDTLFEHQEEWSNLRDPFSVFAQYAEILGLDAEQFKQDYESKEVANKIRSHEAAGRKLGVSGTPTFVLNGKVISNPSGYDAFKALLVPIVGEPSDDSQNASTTPEGL